MAGHGARSEERLAAGKLPPDLLRELLPTALPPEVLVPPRVGEDACVIALERGALVAATDPITMTGSGVGRHSVLVNANDVAVMGARPRWFLAAVLLPLGTTGGEVRALFEGMIAELDSAGIALVGGHTEVTAAVSQAVVVGQMLGHREDGGFVATGGLRAGDAILQIGAAPVEGAYVLAQEGGAAVADLAPSVLAAASDAIEEPGISVVASALLATELGATALHDPTEGGLSAGLHELAEASGLGLIVDPEAVLWFEPGLALCAAVGADPWGTLASGSLVAGFPPDRVAAALEAFASRGHLAARIGRAERGAGVDLAEGRALPRFDRDELSRVLT